MQLSSQEGCGTRPDRRLLPRIFHAILLAPLILFPQGQAALAQSASQHPLSSHLRVLQPKLNESAVMVLAGHPGSGYFAMAHDIATVLVISRPCSAKAMIFA